MNERELWRFIRRECFTLATQELRAERFMTTLYKERPWTDNKAVPWTPDEIRARAIRYRVAERKAGAR